MLRTLLFTILCLSAIVSHAQIFSEVNQETGIDHVARHSNLMGGGAAFVDINNDGYDDLYITGGISPDQLYVNDQNGSFSDISNASGITAATENKYTTGVIFGDIDNNGFKDLFITTRNDSDGEIIPNILLKNQGDLSFENIWTKENDLAFSMGACFLDYDQDGLLDLYVINYVQEVAFLYDENDNIIGFDHTCSANRMYKNIGDGNFQDVSIALGLGDDGCALAVKATDFDQDGDTDILLANDFGEFIKPNKLFENKINAGTFSEVSEVWNADIGMYAMGIAAGDIELDGDLDYYLTNFGKNALMRKDDNSFAEISVEAGVDDTWELQDSVLSVSWGTAFIDYDNNMYPDLYVSNGYVPGPDFLPSSINNNDKFYKNNEDGTFDEIEPSSSGIDDLRVNRGMAFSDFDRDGDIDFITVSLRAPINDMSIRSKMYKNNLDNNYNWLDIDLKGIVSTRDAFGAYVKVFVGDKVLVQESYGGSSHCSQNSASLHFGLGDFDIVDSIQIDWPSRIKGQKLYDIDVNQRISVEEDVNLVSSIESEGLDDLINLFPNPSKENFQIEFSKNFPKQNIKEITISTSDGSLQQKISHVDSFGLELENGAYVLTVLMKNGKKYNRKFFKL